MKSLFLAGVLVLSPLAGFAMCSDGHKTSMSCATGSAWDADKQACLPLASS